MIIDVPSALCAKRFERACGVPSMIHCGRMGSAESSMSAGAVKTTGSDTVAPEDDRRPLNRGNPNKT
jgi:hypothetical protein